MREDEEIAKKAEDLARRLLLTTRKGSIIEKSEELVETLEPYSEKIEISGNIRRGAESEDDDIDVVLIPENYGQMIALKRELKRRGSTIQEGDRQFYVVLDDGTKVNLYFTDEESWGATLEFCTGGRGHNIGMRTVAKKKGFKLTRWGLFDRETGEKIAGETEAEIYHALGKRWKPPTQRSD